MGGSSGILKIRGSYSLNKKGKFLQDFSKDREPQVKKGNQKAINL